MGQGNSGIFAYFCLMSVNPKIWVLLLLLLATCRSEAQSSGNPFELLPRMNVIERADSSEALVLSGNPFDLVKDSRVVPEQEVISLFPVIDEPLKLKEAEEVPQVSQEEVHFRNFLFLAVLLMFVLLTVLVTLFRHSLQQVFRAFLNDNFLTQVHREQGWGLSLPYLLFYLFFFFSAGLCLFIVTQKYGFTIVPAHALSLILFTAGVTALFTGKHILLKLLGIVFPIGRSLSIYSFTITIFGIVLGLFLVPANLLLAYGPAGLFDTTLYILLGIIGLLYLFRSLRALFIGSKFLVMHKFHFLLYLCTVELAPVLILAKILQSDF